jgi:outer membrane protein
MLHKGAFTVVAALTISATANAQSAGDFVTNVGWLHFALQESSKPLTVNALGTSVTAPGTGASVDNADSLGLTSTYFFTDHIATTVVLGIPPKFRLTGTGSISTLGEIGSAYEWSPALLLKYVFNDSKANLRPDLGAGASYVWFSGVKLGPATAGGSFLYTPTLGSALTGPTSGKLSSSFAPVIDVGITYNLSKHWAVDASLAYMWLSTRASLSTQSKLGTITSTTKLKLDPIISFVSVAYKF